MPAKKPKQHNGKRNLWETDHQFKLQYSVEGVWTGPEGKLSTNGLYAYGAFSHSEHEEALT